MPTKSGITTNLNTLISSNSLILCSNFYHLVKVAVLSGKETKLGTACSPLLDISELLVALDEYFGGILRNSDIEKLLKTEGKMLSLG